MQLMNAYKIISAVLIVVFLLVISAYVVVITRNITVSSSIWLFDWNPPPARNAIPLALTYPEALVPSFPNGTMFMANMLLIFSGELEENTLVQVENASCQIPPQGNVNVIAIGFQDAFLPNATSNIQQGYTWGNGAVCVAFSRTQQSPPESWSNLTVAWQNNIMFPVAGDYSPSIFMTVDDSSSPVQYTYSQIKVHVLSASEVNAERTNRLNLGLTFAVLAFSYIEGFMVIHELLKKEETKTQGERTPATTTPAIIKPPPTKSIPKSSVSSLDDTNQRARLDYYTKNKALHATLIVSVLFGLFSILRMITHFSWNAFVNGERSLEQLVLVMGYLFLVVFGSYIISRYNFYTRQAGKESRVVGAENGEKNDNSYVVRFLRLKVSEKTLETVFDKADWGFAIFGLVLLMAVLFL